MEIVRRERENKLEKWFIFVETGYQVSGGLWVYYTCVGLKFSIIKKIFVLLFKGDSTRF